MLSESIITHTVISVRRGNVVDSAINKGFIAYFSMCMCESALFLLRLWNLTPTVMFLDPIFLYEAGTPAKSRTLKAETGIFMFLCIFRTFWPQMAVFGEGRIGEGVVRCWPRTNSFLVLGVVTCVPLLAKIDKKCDCESADRHDVKPLSFRLAAFLA